MNRFFIPPNHITDQTVTFPSEISHQIRHVLRLNQDDLVDVLDNSGKIYRTRLDGHPIGNWITGTVIEIYQSETESAIPIIIYFGLTSREKVELILQKGTETGVTGFHPFISERTLIQSVEKSSAKTDRWERIIREAAEQSGRGRLPELWEPLTFAGCLQNAKQENGLNLIAWEEADVTGQSLKESLNHYETGRIGLFVGPEGGFSMEEVELARSLECRIVSLGARTLRMETAAILFPALVLSTLNAL